MDGTPGPRVLGGYVLEERIGAGAMGTVWRARRRDGGAVVAVKVLRDDIARNAEQVKRFAREGEAMLQVVGPHVATLLETIEEDGAYALVTEYVAGGDLRQWLQGRGPVPLDRAAALGGQILDGLASVHAAGIVHRDVKPENILLRSAVEAPELVLSDFGISRLADLSTITHGVIGTPYYLAPEVAGGERATPASDLYAAGIVIYELLAGSPPFAGEHPLAVMRAHVDRPVPQLVHCPPPLWGALTRLLAKQPDERPASAAAARDELRAATAGLSGDDPRPALLGRLATDLVVLTRRSGTVPTDPADNGLTRTASSFPRPGAPPPPPPMPRPPARSPGGGWTAAAIAAAAAVVLLALLVRGVDQDDSTDATTTTTSSLSLATDGDTDTTTSIYVPTPDPTPEPTPEPVYEEPTTTEPETTTTTAPPPAETDDCIQVLDNGDFAGTASCSTGGGTYLVTQVVEAGGGGCSNSEDAYIFESGYQLCLMPNLVETYCYDLHPGTNQFITPAQCGTPGTVHVVDIVPGATDNSACTQAFQWNRSYNFNHPLMVVCTTTY